eukprot:CAMPEP_0181186780 /NCGR_PEP_ID=MMETSP1096-20121128/10216_1 /TAXON_ID=156174 ORGANISM="Chrysochromulina ericina, Strain CCMP281" /NCGR_SAMPLE_ID=MMETSP1096 /ASSEMBLY_ACC=CAM_ASM_000453 /LENGTH=122 /DNA_ID=CAMNT_0023275699 /DNA_START=431 /DNA_END=801 /DNA_ORIENTATION=+
MTRSCNARGRMWGGSLYWGGIRDEEEKEKGMMKGDVITWVEEDSGQVWVRVGSGYGLGQGSGQVRVRVKVRGSVFLRGRIKRLMSVGRVKKHHAAVVPMVLGTSDGDVGRADLTALIWACDA